MLTRFKRIFLIINFKTMVITTSALLSTEFCIAYGISANYPLTLIATSIVFPVVFSIGGAYKRRESALDQYGIMKAHGKAIYFAARDWLEDPDKEVLDKTRKRLYELFFACRILFTEPVSEMRENENRVYDAFSSLSKFIKTELRGNGLAGGEVSRCNQYLSKTMVSFERIKHVYQYRTPRTLRAFSDVFVTVLPALYGPYFAHIAKDFDPHLIYVMPVLFSFILVSLDNIQEHLENPFDQVGEDDVTINAEEFLDRLQ